MDNSDLKTQNSLSSLKKKKEVAKFSLCDTDTYTHTWVHIPIHIHKHTNTFIYTQHTHIYICGAYNPPTHIHGCISCMHNTHTHTGTHTYMGVLVYAHTHTPEKRGGSLSQKLTTHLYAHLIGQSSRSHTRSS